MREDGIQVCRFFFIRFSSHSFHRYGVFQPANCTAALLPSRFMQQIKDSLKISVHSKHEISTLLFRIVQPCTMGDFFSEYSVYTLPINIRIKQQTLIPVMRI